jgi:hypothetical protein
MVTTPQSGTSLLLSQKGKSAILTGTALALISIGGAAGKLAPLAIDHLPGRGGSGS